MVGTCGVEREHEYGCSGSGIGLLDSWSKALFRVVGENRRCTKLHLHNSRLGDIASLDLVPQRFEWRGHWLSCDSQLAIWSALALSPVLGWPTSVRHRHRPFVRNWRRFVAQPRERSPQAVGSGLLDAV
jgi:hypothetical protein